MLPQDRAGSVCGDRAPPGPLPAARAAGRERRMPAEPSAVGDDYPVPVIENGLRLLSPTDLAQYIMLGQCQRHLRLRLHQRRLGTGFLRRANVRAQEIPPLRTRSGAAFEQEVLEAIERRVPVADLRDEHPGETGVVDNERVVELARDLRPGEVVVAAQPFLQAAVGGWLLRGQADLIRLERNADGDLLALPIDIKRSATSRVEHRLQVAFYDRMLRAILDEAGVALAGSDLGILYRGPAVPDPDLADDERQKLERQAADAAGLLGVEAGAYLDVVADADAFRAELDRLVFDPDSLSAGVAARPFAAVPFHLGQRCDQCLYAGFCLRWTREHDDVSLVPFLSDRDKSILRLHRIDTVAALAALKEPVPGGDGKPNLTTLRPAPGAEAVVEALHVSPPVGPRLDELVHRARRIRRDTDGGVAALSYIPSKGPSSLPASTPTVHPNLVRVFLDVQTDEQTGRVYLAGSFVSAAKDGAEAPERQRAVVHVAGRPPDAADEAGLLVRWVRETLEAIDGLAQPDPAGGRTAPIHVVMWSGAEQRALLDALDRNAQDVLGATALHEFLTQLAGFDSPVLSLLSEEIRIHKNYPFLCQSLQAVSRYLRFDWGTFREVFNRRLFDDRLPLDRVAHNGSAKTWYTARARFASAIPQEYAYAAWDDLPPPRPGDEDPFRDYRAVTTRDLTAFQEKRLRAMHHVANDIRPNADTVKTPFALPELRDFSDRARTLADALHEFMLIERHVELAEWRAARNAPPEQRVLAGASLLVRYLPEDQEPEVRERNAAWREWTARRGAELAALKLANPEATWKDLPKDPDAPPSIVGATVRLRLTTAGVGAPLTEVLGLSGFREGDWVVARPRWTVDSTLPPEQQTRRPQTPKQLLYGMRGSLERLEIERDGEGRAVNAWAHLAVEAKHANNMQPFAFSAFAEPFDDDETWTIEPDPNDLYGYGIWKVVQGIREGKPNALLTRLAGGGEPVAWPAVAAAAQARFLAGLEALWTAGHFHDLPAEVRQYVGRRGEEPLLLVQGPPGTGKSYTTAFALFARIQGAMATGTPFRVGACANTHAAVDVLLEKLVEVRGLLGRWRLAHPTLFADHFDQRLLDVPLFRFEPKAEPPAGVGVMSRDTPKGEPKPVDRVNAAGWCVVAGTPAGLKNLCNGRSKAPGATLDCLVLDEASRMKVPEAVAAAIPLTAAGAVIVVGDHRQMQPIRKHDWEEEPRKTFQEYKVYRSVFDTVQDNAREPIRLSESHRLHEAMAEFLRQEVYHKDDIDYRSARRWTIRSGSAARPVAAFVDAVLRPEFPLVAVVHDERESQLRNETERDLIAPIAAEVLAREYGLREGFGIVVPHRAQRALLQDALRGLVVGDDAATVAAEEAVDTVERFQGGERDVIVVSATESDPAYLLAAGEFLYDPTRLTVALSRAKRKLVLVAARSVFEVFSPEEETFENALLWKNLLRRTCTELVWEGEIAGHAVRAWGKRVRPEEEVGGVLDAVGDGLLSPG
jgi:hypothetical protein